MRLIGDVNGDERRKKEHVKGIERASHYFLKKN